MTYCQTSGAASLLDPHNSNGNQRDAQSRLWTALALAQCKSCARDAGNNLNQIARWANTQAAPIDAVEIIVYLIAIEREVARLARFRGERHDARGPTR